MPKQVLALSIGNLSNQAGEADLLLYVTALLSKLFNVTSVEGLCCSLMKNYLNRVKLMYIRYSSSGKFFPPNNRFSALISTIYLMAAKPG
jgi:hypothetical protein